MAYWLLKSEASSYGWDDLVRDNGTEWDGVRNAAAALNLKAMKVGDRALIYHSMDQKAAVGTAHVTRTARPDGEGDRWVSVRIEPDVALAHPVTLAAMKSDPRLTGLQMIRQSRLSVSPVTDAEWKAILDMGRG